MSAIGKADLPGGSEAGAGVYNPHAYELLKTIDDPAVLHRLDRRGLQQLADELRAFILESVSQTGGHLSSNLGTVELTIALHHVFNTPYDRIVWDVGHQTYPHKILTGRRDAMARLRMMGGISGFPRRSESEYDTFGTAHSSTSISAALGMAQAAKLRGETGDRRRHVIAVIGDGAMSAGMAFEALNNAGVMDTDLLVILNDNDMSISPAVGALNRYLARLMSGRFYVAAKNGDIELMRLLVEFKADPAITTLTGVTPLMVAAGLDTWEGETPGPFTGVPEAERLEAVKFAVSLGADVNARANFGDYPMEGDVAYTLLYYPHNIDKLLELGVGDPRWNGSTPLIGAIMSNQPSIVQYLVDQGADVRTKTTLGWTPLDVAGGVFCCNAKKEFPAAAAIIRKAMEK